ncbi:MAG: AmmeMemoRadiSam system protein A [Selenomonadaceae bacterium]|nr:AmmeMemoRadiSam system protein A [Selenomonadaceae bacterium]
MGILGAAVVPHPPIILPEIGNGEEEKISATKTAYEEVARRIVDLNPDTIIITTPHSIMYADYFHISPGEVASGNMQQFRARQVAFKINYDVDLVKQISLDAMTEKFPAGTLGERNPELDHGTMIPLYFLEKAGLDFKRVKFLRIGLSGLSRAIHYKFGQIINAATEKLGRRIFFLASGDLSHKLKADGPYGYVEEAPLFDFEVMKNLSAADFFGLLTMDNTICSRAAECGHRSFQIMAGALDRRDVTAEKLSYEGTFGVGYGVVWFNIGGENPARDFDRQYAEYKEEELIKRKATEDDYVKLARYSLETFVKTKKVVAVPDDLPEELFTTRAGAFVSLHKDGNLRGCIGTTQASQENLAEEIIHNAISACSRDPRFDPVTVDELEDIEYSVDVLSPAERVFSVSDLDVKRYGIIVANGTRQGLLLPDLEGVDTVQEQLAIAKRKAGIRSEEKVLLWRFKVIRHK